MRYCIIEKGICQVIILIICLACLIVPGSIRFAQLYYNRRQDRCNACMHEIDLNLL
jgi:hypothetical protein